MKSEDDRRSGRRATSANGGSRVPPCNLEAECAVLGALLLDGRDGDGLPRAVEALTPSAFYLGRHRVIFEALREMFDRGEPVDLLTVTEELRRRGTLDEAGGPAVLASLVEAAVIPAHLDRYIRIVQEKDLKREVLQRATRLVDLAYDDASADEIIAAAADLAQEVKERSLSATSAVVPEPLGEVLDRVVADLRTGRVWVVRTPLPGLNTLLGGGLRPGELAFVGGRPGLGKTALALKAAVHAAEQGNAVLVISREMVSEALGRRILVQRAKIPASALRANTLTETDWELIHAVLPSLRDLPLWLTDRALTIGQIETAVHALHARYEIKLLVVDYLQLVQAPKSITERRLAVEFVSQALKAIAVDHQIAVLCLSSLSRPERGAPRKPVLADLRESGALEHDADIVLFLHRPDEDDSARMQLLVAKGRDVGTGEIELMFFGNTLTFEERSCREPGDEATP